MQYTFFVLRTVYRKVQRSERNDPTGGQPDATHPPINQSELYLTGEWE